jgi:hypothetical protein
VAAVQGKVPAGVEDPWFWKDDLHIEKRLYYTRIFRAQPGFISNKLLPAFIATNGVAADEVFLTGLLSAKVQQIYQIIEAEGPISTKNLKRLLLPEIQRSASRLLIELERRFLITKCDITGRTRGTYSYVWDLVERWIPKALLAADNLGREKAEVKIRKHFMNFDIPPESDFYAKVLEWE